MLKTELLDEADNVYNVRRLSRQNTGMVRSNFLFIAGVDAIAKSWLGMALMIFDGGTGRETGS